MNITKHILITKLFIQWKEDDFGMKPSTEYSSGLCFKKYLKKNYGENWLYKLATATNENRETISRTVQFYDLLAECEEFYGKQGCFYLEQKIQF